MQLDQTRIAIRERGYLDIADLSLMVMRHHAWPLMLSYFPLLVHGFELNTLEQMPGYICLQSMFILFELPTASALLTLYLGQAMFLESPSPRRIFSEFSHSLPQLFVFQMLLRGLLIVACIFPLLLYYVGSPYLNEIILLERNKISNTLKRSSVLHAQSSNLLIGRWLAAILLSSMLFLALWQSLAFFRQKLFGGSLMDLYTFTWEWPLAMWLVCGLFAIVRYLSYLDLRIRREGWEIELRMRAEAARLTRHFT